LRFFATDLFPKVSIMFPFILFLSYFSKNIKILSSHFFRHFFENESIIVTK
jgi:hypothetical protein